MGRIPEWNTAFDRFLKSCGYDRHSASIAMAKVQLAREGVAENNSNYKSKLEKYKVNSKAFMDRCTKGKHYPRIDTFDIAREALSCSYEELYAVIEGRDINTLAKTNSAKTQLTHTSENVTNQLKTQLDNQNLNYYLNYFIKCGNKLKVKSNLHFNIFNDIGDQGKLAS